MSDSNEHTRYRRWTGPLGPMTLAARGAGVCGIWFDGQKHHPSMQGWQEDAGGSDPLLRDAVRQLEAYFSSAQCDVSLALDLSSGTVFQRAVWQALQGIPVGQTRSYGALAAAVGRPEAVRAVAAAIGRNPISIFVPCHRVLGRDGALTGYAGGIARKSALLTHEGVRPARRKHADADREPSAAHEVAA